MADVRKSGGNLPVKAGFARWLLGFRDTWFVPCTSAGAEWQRRDAHIAMAHVPGRMVDAADEMLAAWRLNANSAKAGPSGFFPVILVAVAKDINPLPPEFGHALLRPMFFQLPGDDRWVKLRTSTGTLRAQLLVVATDIETARDMASQFMGYTQDVVGTAFHYTVDTAGKLTKWPCQVRAGDAFAMPEPQEQYRINALRIDVELVPTIPHVDAGPGGAGYPAAGAAVICGNGHATQTAALAPGASLSFQVLPQTHMGEPGLDVLGGFTALMRSLAAGRQPGGATP